MRFVTAVLPLLLIPGLVAQEGHPLRGTWHGDWGPDATHRTSVTLVMDWDGKDVTGTLNPGLRSSPLENTVFEPAGWKFHFESNYRDRNGGTTRISADVHIVEVTNARRSLVGTWTQGAQKGDFKVVRDN